MEIIQKAVASGSSTTLVLSSIPSTYTDLYVAFSLRQATGQNAIARVTFNGTSSNLSSRTLAGTGSGVSSFATSAVEPVVTQQPDTANTFGSGSLYIPNYAGSTAKSFSIDAVSENNGTTAFQRIIAGLWNDTTAINSITFTSPDGNWAAGSSATLYGIKRYNTSAAPKATGGIITFDAVNNKWVHAFTASGTFTPTENLTGVEYLVVAGGGGAGGPETVYGGGGWYGGAGGAGGYRSSVVGESSGGGASAEATLSLTSGVAQTVTVGAGGTGGAGASGTGNNGTQGSDSVFGSITSTGGGRGAAGTGNAASRAGFSGGSGSGAGSGGNSAASGGAGTTNQGYAGGSSTNTGLGGGGGGAGSAVSGTGRVRGSGLASSITGSSVTRAVGGFGGTHNADNAAGLSNTGNGGDTSTSFNGSGNNGASGIVIIRYSA